MISRAVLLAGAVALSLTGAAQARDPRCGQAVLCNEGTVDLVKSGWHVHGLNGDKRSAKFACDENGLNCHWTRSYFIDDDGIAQYDRRVGGDDELKGG